MRGKFSSTSKSSLDTERDASEDVATPNFNKGLSTSLKPGDVTNKGPYISTDILRMQLF